MQQNKIHKGTKHSPKDYFNMTMKDANKMWPNYECINN